MEEGGSASLGGGEDTLALTGTDLDAVLDATIECAREITSARGDTSRGTFWGPRGNYWKGFNNFYQES